MIHINKIEKEAATLNYENKELRAAQKEISKHTQENAASKKHSLLQKSLQSKNSYFSVMCNAKYCRIDTFEHRCMQSLRRKVRTLFCGFVEP